MATPVPRACRRGDVDTGFIAKHAEDLKEPPPTPKNKLFLMEAQKARKASKK